ncbi:MAG: hypothetical protein V1845_02890 [bacterium]
MSFSRPGRLVEEIKLGGEMMVDEENIVRKTWQRFEGHQREVTAIEAKLKRKALPEGKKEKLIFRRNYLQGVIIPRVAKAMQL